MQRWGINYLRLGFQMPFWRTNPQDNNGLFFKDNYKRVIELADEYGIYVAVTPGWYPGWNDDGLPWPPFGNSAISLIASEADFVTYWLEIANELSIYPNVLFDLMNEPHRSLNYGTMEDVRTSCFRVYQNVIYSIRNAGINTPIILEWTWGIWFNPDYPYSDSPANPLTDRTWKWVLDYNFAGTNIIADSHMYREAAGQQDRYYTYADVKNAYETYIYMLEASRKMPLINGECGLNLASTGHDQEWFTNHLRVLSEWNIGWAVWWWRDDLIYRIFENGQPYFDYPTISGQIIQQALTVPTYYVTVSPSSSNLIIGQAQTFTTSVVGGTPPYTYEWTDTVTGDILSTEQTFLFNAFDIGTFTIKLAVTDSTLTTTETQITITVTEQGITPPPSPIPLLALLALLGIISS